MTVRGPVGPGEAGRRPAAGSGCVNLQSARFAHGLGCAGARFTRVRGSGCVEHVSGVPSSTTPGTTPCVLVAGHCLVCRVAPLVRCLPRADVPADSAAPQVGDLGNGAGGVGRRKVGLLRHRIYGFEPARSHGVLMVDVRGIAASGALHRREVGPRCMRGCRGNSTDSECSAGPPFTSAWLLGDGHVTV